MLSIKDCENTGTNLERDIGMHVDPIQWKSDSSDISVIEPVAQAIKDHQLSQRKLKQELKRREKRSVR